MALLKQGKRASVCCLSTGRYLKMSEVNFDCCNWVMLLTSSGQKPGMLLYILQCVGTTKNYPAQNTSCDEVEKS